MLVDLVTGANSTFPPIAPRVASYAGISGLFRRPPLLPYPPLPGSADVRPEPSQQRTGCTGVYSGERRGYGGLII